MAFIADYALDGLVAKLIEGTRIDICSQEPTTYAEATSTYSKGNKTSVTAGAAADRTPNGRKTTVPATTGGSVTATATVTHWAWTDPANSRLLATGALAASQAVTSGNTFSLGSFDLGVPDAA
jgi:hypothetical protein